MGVLVAMGVVALVLLVVVTAFCARSTRRSERRLRSLVLWRVLPPAVTLIVFVGPIVSLAVSTDDAETNPFAATFGVLFMLYGFVPIAVVPVLVGMIVGTTLGLLVRRRAP